MNALTPLQAAAEFPRERAFLVKLRRDDGAGDRPLAGRVEHLDSGLRRDFADAVELAAALVALVLESARRGA